MEIIMEIVFGICILVIVTTLIIDGVENDPTRD